MSNDVLNSGERAVLVDRDDEVGLVADLLRAGTCVLVTGPAGIGKSRLLSAVASVLAASATPVRQVVCSRAASTIPLGSLVPWLPPHAVERADADLLAAAISGLQGDDGTAIVVLVDDAHHLDTASVAVLEHLRGHGVALLLAVRDGEPVARSVADLWRAGTVERVALPPLSGAGVEHLLEHLLVGDVDLASIRALARASAGNPLLVRELVTAGLRSGDIDRSHGVWRWNGRTGAVATSLGDLVAERCDHLAPDAMSALERLSLAEDLPASALGPGADALERSGMAVSHRDGLRLRFRLVHPVYGDVVREGMTAGRRDAVAAELIDLLHASGARRSEDRLLSARWSLDTGIAVDPDLLLDAARHATATFDHELAERCGARALALGGGPRAAISLAMTRHWLGRPGAALEALAGIDPSSLDERLHADLAVATASPLCWGLGRYDEAEAVVADALARCGAPDVRGELLTHLAGIQLFAGRLTAAAEAAEGALALGPPLDAALRGVAALATAKTILGSPDEAGLLAMTHVGPAMAAPEIPLALGEAMVAMAFTHWGAGRLDAAEALVGTLHETVASQARHDALGGLALSRAAIAVLAGHLERGERWAREAAALLARSDVGGLRPWALGLLAHAAAQRGDAATAADAIAALPPDPAPSPLYALDVALGRAWTAFAEGDVAGARAIVVDAVRTEREEHHPLAELIGWHALLRLGGVPDLARVDVVAAGVQGELAALLSCHVAAAAARDAGALESLSERFRAAGMPLFAAEAGASAIVCRRQRGEPVGTLVLEVETLRRSTGGARTPLLLALAASEIGLTAREREIAALAASGLSSREIGERLFLSRRTVDNHLGSVYTKLGISGRDELEATTF